jgi:transcriptional regulator with XRE-family HTH domain
METKPMCSNVQKIYKFSEWLKSELDSRHLTVARLAQISGVHPNTIRNYLAERCEPTLFNVQCIVNALDYDMGVIPRGDQ